MEPINSITILDTKLLQNFYVFIIKVTCPVKEFVLQKRFKEFVALNESLTELGSLMPLPPKTLWNTDQVAQFRKQELEKWLQSILYSKDAIFRRSKAWCDFMNVPYTQNTLELPRKLDHLKWMQEYEILFSFLSQIKAVWNERSRAILTGDSAQAQAKKYEVKKGLKQVQERLDTLNQQLDHDGLVDGEFRRRMDLVANMKKEMKILDDGLSTFVVSTEAIANNKSDLLANQSGKQSRSSRKFGLPQETVETRILDDEGLLQLQEQKMQLQDKVVESIASTVKRQKEIALTISDELDIQTKMLQDMDEAVDNVEIRLKNADKKIQRLF